MTRRKDAAKDRARDRYRRMLNDGGADDFEHIIDDAATIAEMLGIELETREAKSASGKTWRVPLIYWSLGYSQSDGAGFDARYGYAKGSCAAIREYAPKDAELHRIADALRDVQRRHFYRLWADVSEYRSMGVSVEVSTDGPETLTADDEREVKDAIRDFAQWIYDQLRREDEYRNSDECVDDYLSSGDEEFTEDGRRA